MSSFKKLLEKFDQILRKYNPVNYAMLKSPLTREKVERYINSWGIHDDNLTELFSWKNGFNFRGRIQNKIFDWGAFLSVERTNRYVIEDSTLEPVSDTEEKKVFIPLTENGSGDTLLFSLEENEFGRIYLYSVALLYIDEPISYYDSLTAMIETEIQAYEKGLYDINKETGYLDVDNKKFFSLAKKLNKKSDYWKQVY